MATSTALPSALVATTFEQILLELRFPFGRQQDVRFRNGEDGKNGVANPADRESGRGFFFLHAFGQAVDAQIHRDAQKMRVCGIGKIDGETFEVNQILRRAGSFRRMRGFGCARLLHHEPRGASATGNGKHDDRQQHAGRGLAGAARKSALPFSL